MLNNKLRRAIYLIYLLMMIVFYCWFLTLDFADEQIEFSLKIKYASIILTTIITILFFNLANRRTLFYLLAISSICVADYFLLFTTSSSQQAIGVVFFIIAHLLLFNLYRFKVDFMYLIVGLMTIILVLFSKEELLINLAIVYATCLISNTIFATITLCKRVNWINLCLLIGFILLILCDIHVAMYNLGYGNTSKLMWLFYTPSIIFINYSCISKKRH